MNGYFENRSIARPLLWTFLLGLVLITLTVLAMVYYPSRTFLASNGRQQVLTINSDYVGYYHGLGLHNGTGFIGKNWFRIHVDEGNDCYWEVDMNGYGYSPYRGYYPNGNLREEGICLVEENGGPGGDPAPDRHQVLQGRYYDPQGKLVGEIEDGTGVQILFFPDGTKSWELELLQGKRVKVRLYWPSGNIASAHSYDSEENPHGLYTSDHKDGTPRTRGRYDFGSKVGIWYRFHEDGSVENIEDFRIAPPTIPKFDPGAKHLDVDLISQPLETEN